VYIYIYIYKRERRFLGSVDKMMENRRFGDGMRREDSETVRTVMELTVQGEDERRNG